MFILSRLQIVMIKRKRPRKYIGASQHFHNFEHSKEGRTHCTGPISNPYKIEHANGKHKISHQFAKGHGRGGKTQWFRFTKELDDGYDMSSGVKVNQPTDKQKRLT